MNFVIKSNGVTEAYDSYKLEKSLIEAFRITKSPAGQAEHSTKYVLAEFQKWVQDKPEITSSDISRQVGKILGNIDPSTAYIFKNFKSIIIIIKIIFLQKCKSTLAKIKHHLEK